MRFVPPLFLFMVLAGCAGQQEAGPLAIRATSTEAKFAQAAMEGKWDAAYGRCSSHWKKKWSSAATQAFYDGLVRDVERETGKPFKPDTFSISTGKTPSDPFEARESFGVTTDAPKESWRRWVVVTLSDSRNASRAALAMLLVQEKGTEAIAYVDFRSTNTRPSSGR